MSMVSITGLGAIPVTTTEYVDPTLASTYSQAINTIASIYAKRSDNPSYANTSPQDLLSDTDYDNILAAIQQLTTIAKDGAQQNLNGQSFQTFITANMATSIDNIIKSLKAVGIPPSSSTPLTSDQKVSLLQTWQSLAGYGVDAIMRQASQADLLTTFDPTTGQYVNVPAGRTVQSMIELEYIKTGNDVIFSDLSDLEQASSITNNILTSLQIIQNISNQISAPAPTPFDTSSLNGITNPDDYANQYKNIADAHFTQQIPIAIPTSTTGYDLLAIKKTLSSQLAQLINVTPSNPSGGTTANIVLNQGSLASTLKTVLQDISAAFTNVNINDSAAVKSAVSRWILDSQNILIDTQGSQGNAGAIQGHLAIALSTAENLNESQKENVRRYMYIFQEFYKSASAMLTLLGEILDKIGGNVGGAK